MGKGMWAKFFAHIGKGENAAGWRETDPRMITRTDPEHSGSVPLCPLSWLPAFQILLSFVTLQKSYKKEFNGKRYVKIETDSNTK